MKRRQFLSILGVATGSALLFPRMVPAEGLSPFEWTGAVLGAEASFTLLGKDTASAQRIASLCLAEIKRLEQIFSLYIPHSAIRKLNREGVLRNPPQELLRVVKQARVFSQLSKGAFDISIQPLWQAKYYDFRDELSQAEIKRLSSLVDYRNIDCSPKEIRFATQGMAITLNGIAQGFITDKIVALLREHGYTSALVNLGEVYGLGKNGEGKPWQVALYDPEDTSEMVFLEDRAVATSGAYGTEDKGRFSHLVDAHNGKSIREYRSLSVLADTATIADGLSTTLSLVPAREHGRILKSFPRAERRLTYA